MASKFVVSAKNFIYIGAISDKHRGDISKFHPRGLRFGNVEIYEPCRGCRVKIVSKTQKIAQ